jgi:hypothetical protein
MDRSPYLEQILESAMVIANGANHLPINAAHVFIAFYENPMMSDDIYHVMRLHSITRYNLYWSLQGMDVPRFDFGTPRDERFTDGVNSALALMEERMDDAHEGSRLRDFEQFFAALVIQHDEDLERVLFYQGISAETLLPHVDPSAMAAD